MTSFKWLRVSDLFKLILFAAEGRRQTEQLLELEFSGDEELAEIGIPPDFQEIGAATNLAILNVGLPASR